MDSLRGQLLVGANHLRDPNFHRTVVLLLEHNDEGAFGVVLNRPLEVEVDDVLPGWGGGQLEDEIGEHSWFVVDTLPSDAFTPEPTQLWRSVLRRQGGDLAIVANFPEDARLN